MGEFVCVDGARRWRATGVCGGLSPWRRDGRPRGAPKDRSRPPGSVRTHQAESEGLPGGVRRGAPRRAAILQWSALSDIETSTVLARTAHWRDDALLGVRPVRRQRHGTQASSLDGGAPIKELASQAAGKAQCSRDGAPRGKTRIAQSNRCVETSKTRKSCNIVTDVCRRQAP